MNNGERVLTVSERIDERSLGHFQILTTALCALVLVLDGFNAQCIGFLAPPISVTLHVPLKSFGPIFGSGLFGLMLASLAIGPAADRWGRKRAIIVSTIVFGIFTLLTPSVTSFNQLLILRFLTGLGLGGAIPNAIALTVEYAPKRLVSVVVGFLMAGIPLGTVISGIAGSVLMPAWGWRPVLYLGGVLPLVVALVLIKWLPESVRFLALRGGNEEKIAHIMGKISPELATAPVKAMASSDLRREGLPVKHLFTDGRAVGTILLWVPFFMNLLTLFFIVSWLPALMKEDGMSVSAGVAAVTLFSLGGIMVSLAQGWLMNRFGPYNALVTEFGLITLLVASLSVVASSLWLTLIAAFVIGGAVTGAQSGIGALAAHFYPTAIRSTGVGWALGIGRIGSIVGPVLAGAMLGIGWLPQQILLAAAIPAFCSAIAITLSHRLSNPSAFRPEADPTHTKAGATA